ncbi:MAG: putative aminopeptidase NPEPL1 [Kiritimatiellia bacterium]|jgi:probable aminopeptidase NPEPL1
MTTDLRFTSNLSDVSGCPTRIIVGRRSRLLDDDTKSIVPSELTAVWSKMVKSVEPGDDGRATIAWTSQGRVLVGILPEHCSRHNSMARVWSMARMLHASGSDDVGIVIALDEAELAWGAASAVARAWPSFSMAKKHTKSNTVHIALIAPDPTPSVERLQIVCNAVRRAAHWVDAPPNTFNTRELITAARDVASRVGAEIRVIEGHALAEAGFGGIWGVGRGSNNPPAFVVLDYNRENDAAPTLGWVGKGITYDTGGLSIKSKTGMVGMKTDMGGAAAVLAAFEAAVLLNVPRRICAALCIAENSVSADATRPDDILNMYSGRTVEVNNTDAEGRLVLADGLAWMTRHRKPDILLDCATLTGAQLVATGKRHAALYSNSAKLEQLAMDVGRRTGDLCFALPFVPEFYRKEFSSHVADMRNSVKDRANAQTSCAGQFLNNHLRGFRGEWAHIDLAGPAVSQGRGTGYGVNLLLGIAGLLD